MRTRAIAVVASIGVVAVLTFLMFQSRSRLSQVSVPQPNGYDDFLKAGQMLTADPPSPDDLSVEQLKSFVTENAAVLSAVRQGLQRECRVPLSYSLGYATNHMADLGHWKRIVRALVAEGKLAERENRQRDAAQSYLDAIRFGHECCRGGVIIDMLVGVACQSLGCRALQGMAGQLTAADCRQVIEQLEEMGSEAESAREVANQERTWARRTFGLRGQLGALMMRRSLQQNEQTTLAKLQAQQKTANILLIEIAERTYELEKGVSPKGISDLVPTYLKALPRDSAEPPNTIDLPTPPAGKQGGGRHSGRRVQRA